jgi:hypothetical protein
MLLGSNTQRPKRKGREGRISRAGRYIRLARDDRRKTEVSLLHFLENNNPTKQDEGQAKTNRGSRGKITVPIRREKEP